MIKKSLSASIFEVFGSKSETDSLERRLVAHKEIRDYEK